MMHARLLGRKARKPRIFLPYHRSEPAPRTAGTPRASANLTNYSPAPSLVQFQRDKPRRISSMKLAAWAHPRYPW